MLQEVEEILLKYKKQEEAVEDFLERAQAQIDSNADCKKDNEGMAKFLSFEQVRERNKSILKDLEIVKGNLRSKAIFSPTEMQWEKICNLYQEEPSLPVTTWKCNLPVFV